MFSSSGNNNNNTNNNPYNHQFALPFYQQYSSSMHPLISHDMDNNNVLYHHYYQHPLLAGQQLLPGYVVPESTTNAALNNSINASGFVPTNALPEKPVKKDRHSKIYTAQGLRDRRVRLSTEISRQFFDLQDLLGYDKASETIAWLLSKSKKDIKELVEMKTKSLSSPDSEMISQNDRSLIGASKEKKVKSKRAAEFQLLRKETRATKAREKMWLNQERPASQFDQVGENLGSLRGFSEFGGKSTDFLASEDIMEESIMITRKLKPASSSGLGYQHIYSCVPENSDMNGAISASSCGANATTSMNLSTELLISGKTWDACNSQCLD